MASCQSIPCCSSVFLPLSRLIANSLKPSLLFSKTHKFNFFKRPINTSKFLPLAPPRVATPPAQTGQQENDGEVQTQDETGGESSSDKFSWRDHWYPVSLVEDLDPKLPTAFQLLGRDLVIWLDGNEDRWVVFDDKCPHRLAPLSEGRIDEDGNLQCSYHGWSFDGCGSCTKIPQASSEGPEARAQKSPRACAGSFPAMVSQGLLFVWPDENGWEKANSTKPARLPDDFDKPEFSTVTIQRDLFYGYDTLMENVSDPSHIDFAHHKVTGRRDRAKPLPFKLESSGPWGFEGSNDGNPRISAKFVAPCYYINKIEIDTKLPVVGDQKWVIWICSFNVPMAPGKTRSIVCSARNFFQFTVPGPAWWQVVPRWHEHWTSNKVYDGDMIVLQGQEKIFLSKSTEGIEDINKHYTNITFTPTQADRFVLAFRNWLKRHGQSQPEWFGSSSKLLPPSTHLSRKQVLGRNPSKQDIDSTEIPDPSHNDSFSIARQMLDRFEQHTRKCTSCKNAFEAFQKWQKLLIGMTVICCATVGIASDIPLRVLLAGAAILFATAAYALHELGKNFIYVDYVHAEIE